MKLIAGLIAAAAGFAAAAQQAADVYILPSLESTSTTTTPSISRHLARVILMQRLSTAGKGPSVTDIPTSIDEEDALNMINKFGKAAPQLFSENESSPKQLVLLIEGMTPAQIQDARDQVKISPAFTVPDPPSARGHEKLVTYDFYNVGATGGQKCSLSEITDPFETKCWKAKSAVGRYSIQKNPKAVDQLVAEIGRLTKLAQSGEMETTILLLPHDKETVATSWSPKPQELRRRQAEEPLEDDDASPAAPTSAASNPAFTAKKSPVPACFISEDDCVTSTGNCSSHGVCLNRYANADGSEGKEACYVCHCLSTASEKGSVTHWAGSTCSKKDVSVAFWLFAGFTIIMVTIVWLAISMLFGVGEEKLPGVIGAGVSKSK